MPHLPRGAVGQMVANSTKFLFFMPTLVIIKFDITRSLSVIYFEYKTYIKKIEHAQTHRRPSILVYPNGVSRYTRVLKKKKYSCAWGVAQYKKLKMII
jgi:hypothetical protein